MLALAIGSPSLAVAAPVLTPPSIAVATVTDDPTVQTSVASVAAPAPPVNPSPESLRLPGFQYIRQTLNNCGPASIAEVLHYWGVERTQDDVRVVLRPDG